MAKNWSDAEETCLNINSDLVSIKSEEENKFVVDAFIIIEYAWIGLRLGSRVWSDNSSASYFGLNPVLSSPNEGNCYVLANTLQWVVIPCSAELKQAVCKRMGLYRVLRVISSLDQFMPTLYFTIIPIVPLP